VTTPRPPAPSNPILLYDGVCGLCNRLVRFLLKRDRQDRFRFASLQSGFARTLLSSHGASPDELDTFYLVLDYAQHAESLLARSDAAVAVMRELGGICAALGLGLRILPRGLRDWGYNRIARSRYRIFGRYSACLMPEARYRHKFLDS
jgi:predicted DCC family thiol-disulfide oxidoreductase YuxK